MRSSTGITGASTTTDITSIAGIDANSSPMQDTQNIRVFKNGNVSLNATLNLYSVKTIVVENGDLIVNGDLSYADMTSSYAFIVKKGDIVIAKNVANIA